MSLIQAASATSTQTVCPTMQRARRCDLSLGTSLERIAPESLTRPLTVSFTATSRIRRSQDHYIGADCTLRGHPVNDDLLMSDGLRSALESTRFLGRFLRPRC